MNVRQGLKCDTHTGNTKHAILKALCGSDHWEHPKRMRAWPDTPPCERQLRLRGQGGPKPGVQSFAYFPSMIRTASKSTQQVDKAVSRAPLHNQSNKPPSHSNSYRQHESDTHCGHGGHRLWKEHLHSDGHTSRCRNWSYLFLLYVCDQRFLSVY